jgi:hypothetical protein
VPEEWPRVGNGPGSEIEDNYSSLLEKNNRDSSSLMFYLLRENDIPISHICEWKNGSVDSVYIITMFSVKVDIR